MPTYNYAQNLGYFGRFMKAYGQADYPTRAELYRDTQAYQYGAETATDLYGQVAALLGVTVVSPQLFVSPNIGTAA